MMKLNQIEMPQTDALIREMARLIEILASYECAGIDQEPDDPKPCGKCGPCEARRFTERWEA